MTTPFATFAFRASGIPATCPGAAAGGVCERTLPDRIAEIKNVKDFGAKGDGVTDDWAAITAAFNWSQITLTATGANSGNTIPCANVPATLTLGATMYATDATTPSAIASNAGTLEGFVSGASGSITVQAIAGTVQAGDQIVINAVYRGTIYFPPGTYVVSQPILMNDPAFSTLYTVWLGEQATVVGNFADYVFSQAGNASGSKCVIEGFNITNNNASGGGLRLGSTIVGAIRNLSITANKGINTVSQDTLVGGAYFGSLEISIENCELSPGANTSGSQGMLLVSDGPVTNCRIIGFDNGVQTFGGQGAMVLRGCYFEGCGSAYLPSIAPDGTTIDANVSQCVLTGCRFKNNVIAINFTNQSSGGLYAGLLIEGGANAQYGIKTWTSGSGTISQRSVFAGIKITGTFSVFGASFRNVIGDNDQQNTFMSVTSPSWEFPVSPNSSQFLACDVAAVYQKANLPTSSPPTEGDCYNISDSGSATWGGDPTVAGSLAHAKVRWNGSAWTVMGI